MTSEFAIELQGLIDKLDAVALDGDAIVSLTQPVLDACSNISKAWSGSNVGFHSTIYHSSLNAPPPGEHFSAEWGLDGGFMGTTGDWREFPRDAIRRMIEESAGDVNLTPAKEAATRALDCLRHCKGEATSILSAFLASRPDEFLSSLSASIAGVDAMDASGAARAMLPSEVISRDAMAVHQGLKLAPHQEMVVELVAIRTAFEACAELSALLSRAAKHIGRLTLPAAVTAKMQGASVFIGHGRSSAWRELKDFIQDRMKLEWDEFNRVPVAGVTNIARLTQMLDNAAIAFIVLTAEDQRVDGESLARQNVVHEAGLFQGRLGFTRAIVLLESGCAEFSNIQGLGQVRFSKDNIAETFEEIRGVLEREGIVQ